MSFTRVLIGLAENPKRSFRWSLVSVRQQVAVMYLCSQRTQPKNNVQSQQQKHQEKMPIDFQNNIKNIRTTSPEYQLFAGQSKVCLQLCFQVRRPVISTIVNPFMSFYEKLLPKYLIHKNLKRFFISEKQLQKRTNFSTFYLIFKGLSFQYHKVRHPNFCNMLHLEMDF